MKYIVLFFAMLFIAVRSQAQFCQAGFSYQQDMGVVSFTNESEPIDSFTQFQWTFGDGGTSTAMNPSNNYVSGGYYEVCLTMSNGIFGCSSTYCDSIVVDSNNVINNCSAAFTFEVNGGNVTFFNQSTWDTSAVSFLWSFGDGTSSTEFEPTHYYYSNQIFTACLILTTASGCESEICHPVAIIDSNCVFTVSIQISGNTVSFLPSNGNYAQGTFYWSFGDNTSSNEIAPTHVYSSPGTYAMCVWYTDSVCNSSVCDTIVIGFPDSCYAQFSGYQYGNIMSFYPSWIDYSKTYYWDFGDGTTSGDVTPSHEFTAVGSYYVCLTVSSFLCSSTFCNWVDYSGGNNGGNCQAYFEVSAIDTTSSTVWLTDLSTGGNQYFWDFGDGSSSTEQYPTHSYAQNGFYYVCLSITCDSNMTSEYCAWVGMSDSLQGGDNDVRSGFTLIVYGETTGVAPVAEAETISAFPNPTNESVTINIPENMKGECVVIISNVFGQVVSQEDIDLAGIDHETIDLRKLPPGLYMIQVVIQGKSYTSNVLKQ